METKSKPRNIQMNAVDSSQIAALGYDAETSTLRLQFHGKGDKPGDVYDYSNFGAEDWANFVAADSVGSYFIHNIKRASDRYPYTKIS